jgi:hypothetical protein
MNVMLPVAAVALITMGVYSHPAVPLARVAVPGSVVPTCTDDANKAAGDANRASGNARFAIVDSAGSRSISYSAEVNLVFCRQSTSNMTWIRFAELRENNGGDGPHLDIDVCFLSDGGVFRPMEARAEPCPGGKTWGVWWHESTTRVFATHATSSPCELRIALEPSRLTGTFSCRGLSNDDGTETVDLLDGHFECAFKTVDPARGQELPAPRRRQS